VTAIRTSNLSLLGYGMVCKLREQGERDVRASLKNNNREILEILGANEAKIKRFGVRSLSLFGSCVRGDETAHSDLDFVVEFERKSFDAYMDLKFFLEDLFGKPVDLVLADGIKPRLRAAILEEAVHAPGL
jgi:predicted nucleotidyltransferase